MYVRICDLSEINEGELYRFDVQEKPLLVIKIGEEFVVSQAICSHAEADLTLGILLDGTVTCPLHQARFNLASGRVLSGPNGDSPDSIYPLKVYDTKVDNGVLFADL